jgi:hypothetical protein
MEISCEKFQGLHAVFIQLMPGHAGVTGSSLIVYAFSYLEMEMIRCAEVGTLEFVFAEKTRQGRELVHPFSDTHFNFFDMGVDREQKITVW